MHWLNRYTGYLQRVLTYEDPVHQAKARSLIPIPKLHIKALHRLKDDESLRKDSNDAMKDQTKATKPLDFNVR